MSLEAGRDSLQAAHQNLLARWEHVEPHWQDAMKSQFVEQVLTPLHDQIAAALLAIDQMEVVLHQMRRDCEGNSFDIFGGGEQS